LLNPDKTLAFVLNNGNTGGSTSSDGSIAVYQVGANGLSTTPLDVHQTGDNPVNMALDPGGNYLVVANHGNGSSGGSVEVLALSTTGQLSSSSTSGSPCTYPSGSSSPPRSKRDLQRRRLCGLHEPGTSGKLASCGVHFCLLDRRVIFNNTLFCL